MNNQGIQKILVADDSPDIRELADILLSAEDFEIVSAKNGQEAVDLADDTIMVHIRNLREKIEENPREPQYIKTAWGKGYYID